MTGQHTKALRKHYKILLIVISLILLFFSILLDETYGDLFILKSLAIALSTIAIAMFMAAFLSELETYLRRLIEGPQIRYIDASERCDELRKALLESFNCELYTTRYSNRPVGDKNKSKKYINTLNDRISEIAQDARPVRRIISLDNAKKRDHAIDLLKKHGGLRNFSLAIVKKGASHPFVDLMVCKGKFVCIGLEGRGGEENHWIRIDDENISEKFADYYDYLHWGNKNLIIIKQPGKSLSASRIAQGVTKIEDAFRTR